MERLIFILLFPLTLFAEELTTNNLITNGTFDNGTTGWTLSGDAVRINDCCPGGYDLEFGDSGSIEQSFDLLSDTITQPMLNNGITLNSSVEVQNGECGVAQCWGGSGPADTFTVRLQIRDINDNVLSVTTQERTNVTGINGKDFTDSVSFSGTGSNQGNIFISGADGNSPAYLGGPNVDNISVTMTYDPIVLTTEQTTLISTAVEEVEEIYIEEFFYEEPIIEEVVFQQPTVEIIEEPTLSITEEEFIEETIIFKTEEETIVPEEETIVAEEEVTYETVGETETSSSNEGSESTEVGVEETENNQSTPEQVEESGGSETPRVSDQTITVEDVERRVNQATKRVDQRLIATSLIVAKAMKGDVLIDKYSQINNNIFIQPEIFGGYYEDRTYIDVRNIYAQNQNIYNDILDDRQKQIEQATDEVIRTEEHLRRIRGY